MKSSSFTTNSKMAFGKNYDAPASDIDYFNQLIGFLINECQKVTVEYDGQLRSVTDCLSIEACRLEAKENFVNGIMRGKKRDISVLCAAIELINTLKIVAKDSGLYSEACRQELDNIYVNLCRAVEDLQ